MQLDATPTALCSQGLLRFGRQQGLHGSGQQVAVHDVVTAPIGRNEVFYLTPYALQRLAVALARPCHARSSSEQARCENPGEEIKPP